MDTGRGEYNGRKCFYDGRESSYTGGYLQYDAGSRGNLGEELPVMVYRLLE